MSALLGVHGIGQRRPQDLRERWRRALADGIQRAAGHPVTLPDLSIAFYGDVFAPRLAVGVKAPTELDPLADLSDAELADLLDAAADVVSTSELLAAMDEVKGVPAPPVPAPLQAALRAIDKRFGDAAGVLYLGTLRQALRYLRDQAVKQAVDKKVAEAVTPDTRILLAHSLGSVVAFEHLRQHPGHVIDLLLTMGSPLGLRMVRSSLPDAAFGEDAGKPANVGRWVNLFATNDPVACAGGLAQWWPAIQDRCVDNGLNPHSAQRYLGQAAAGRAVIDVLPELALPEVRA